MARLVGLAVFLTLAWIAVALLFAGAIYFPPS